MTTYPPLGDWHGLKPASADEQAVEIAEMLAWTAADNCTAGRLAYDPVTVRPVCEGCARESWMKAVLRRTMVFEVPWYAMLVVGDTAHGVGHRTIKLDPPVGQVVQVRIDGTPLPAPAWRVDDGNQLVRQDGHFWPTHQDFQLADGAVGTFEVDYYRGFRPGPLMIFAVQRLAYEFYLAATGKKHSLPSNVTAVTRQGVSFQMKAPLFADGLTGITEVDLVFRRYNPYGLSAPTLVASPDSLRRRVRTGGGS